MLPFVFLGGQATVLCVGNDGHVAIEAGVEGACDTSMPCETDSEHEHEDEESEACGGKQDCCGNCVDIALELEAARGKL